MKIAVCLSGQLRTCLYALPSQVQWFISKDNDFEYEIDYFCHTWIEPNLHRVGINDFLEEESSVTINEIEDAIKVCNPKDMLFEKYTDIPYKFPWAEMFYSALMANRLKRKYEINNNFRYDLVVKSRYDLAFASYDSFSNYYQRLTNHISTSDHLEIYVNHVNRDTAEYNKLNSCDVMYYGSSISMDIFSDIFRYLRLKQKIASPEDCEVLGPGALMTEYANIHNMRLIPFDYYEVVYRKDAIPLNPLTNYDQINEIGRRVYTQ